MRTGTQATFFFVSTYDISSIKRNWEVSRCSRAKQRQRNVQKRALRVQSCFLLFRPSYFNFFFTFLVAVAVHDFIFCLSKYKYILTRASFLALAKSIYYLRLFIIQGPYAMHALCCVSLKTGSVS